ncbi:zeta toxin family protein [Pseudomonas neustonica]|uniref:zeta toxin family protein n=1 Tax=Pseudomonas neustonica TaxID=2487346 RepID=UPI003F47B7AF
MTPEEQRVHDDALSYARANRTRIASELVDLSIYPDEEVPLTVFMAGSPGAGKTEVSKAFVSAVENNMPPLPEGEAHVLRIDPDEFRALLPGYTGGNSWLFQAAVIKILEKVLDRAFKKGVSFLLDGTLSSYGVARSNINRALQKGCEVQILYVYQRPEIAWRFVQDRELIEGRNIPIDAFVTQFLAARRNVEALKREFGSALKIDLLIQSESGEGYARVEIDAPADLIDEALPETYDESTLYRILAEGDEYDHES